MYKINDDENNNKKNIHKNIRIINKFVIFKYEQ